MSPLLSDPDELRARISQLEERNRQRRLRVEQREALAEAYFRLAVHRGTPTDEKIRLLLQAIQLDRGNPKLAYHLALVYLRDGQIERAGTWLQTAHGLLPTSHRIWAHVGIAQRALQQQHRGDAQFDQTALRERTERITSAIQQGDDAIDSALLSIRVPRLPAATTATAHAPAPAERPPDPPPAPEKTADDAAGPDGAASETTIPPRLLGAGRCRWSGVNDLLIEDLFERIPTAGIRDRVLRLMEPIARDSTQRRAGYASFVVLAIEWLIRGYPVAAVRRLVDLVAAPPTPVAARLLELVCVLCEAPDAELPARLSAAVDGDELPAALAALIHQRRLLRHRLELPTLAPASRAGWAFVDRARGMTAPDADRRRELLTRAREHSRVLDQALHELQPPREQTIADVAPRQAARALDRSEVTACLDVLEAAVQRLDRLRLDGFELLRTDLAARVTPTADEAVLVQARSDRAAIETLMAELTRASGLVHEQMQQVDVAVQTLGPADAPERFGERRELVLRLNQGLLNQGNFARALGRLDRALPSSGSEATDLPPASERFAGLLAEVREIVLDVERASPAGGGVPTEGDGGARGGASPSERIAALLTTLTELRTGLDDAWDRLRELASVRGDRALDAGELAAGQAIAELVQTALARAEESLAELSGLRAAGTVDPADLGPLGEAEECCRAILTQQGRFGRSLRRLDLPPAPTATPGTAAPPVAGTPDRGVADPEPGAAAPDAPPPAPAAPPRPPNSLFALSNQLTQVDRQVDELFAAANHTFDGYSEAALQAPPFRRLRAWVHGRQAEALHRFGRRAEARQVWCVLLRNEALNARLLQNVAVSDSVDGDAGRTLLSWRSYVELLYFNAVMAGTPRAGAEARAACHREFGAAYAPLFVSAGGGGWPGPPVDEPALLGFLSSPARLRLFVRHTFLAFVNQRLSFSSPPLAIGVARTEGPAIREQAREAQHALIDLARPLLPERVRTSFSTLAAEHIDAAAEASKSARRTVIQADSSYPDQETRHRDWILGVIDLKLRIYEWFFVVENETMRPRHSVISQLDSLDFVEELALLDRLPIGSSPALYDAVARKRHSGDPGLFLTMLATVRKQIVHHILRIVFAGHGNADDVMRERLYRRLVERWVHLPSLAAELPAIDDPGSRIPGVYSDSIRAALGAGESGSERSTQEEAIAALRGLVERYPESTGPARHLAMLLASGGQVDEAFKVLEQARARACSDVGRTACERMRLELRLNRLSERLKRGNVSEAELLAELDPLLEVLAADRGDASLPVMTMQAFVALATVTRRNDRHAELHQVITDWVKRASDVADDEDDAEAEQRQAGVRSVRGTLPDVMLTYVISAAGGLSPQSSNWLALIEATEIARGYYPNLQQAIYVQMMAQFNLGGQERQAGRQDVAERLLKAARTNAQRLLNPLGTPGSATLGRDTEGDQRRAAAQTVLAQVNAALGGS